MNKEYTYIDGKAIIKDENGNQTPVEYYDNLDEVLVQENIIETIENRIAYLESESKEYKKYNKKHYIPVTFPLCALITTIGVPAIFYWLGNSGVYINTINTIFGPMNEALLYSSVFSTVFLPLAGLMEFNMYSQHKDRLKNEKGVNSELDFLKKQIFEEKEKLVELKKQKTKTELKNGFKVVKVDDIEKLKSLKSWFNLYYDLGYNEEKYYDYFQKGKLDSKLSKHYNEIGIEAAKEYLQEKGPTLVKKENKNKTTFKIEVVFLFISKSSSLVSIWWSRGESHSCPNALTQYLLQV